MPQFTSLINLLPSSKFGFGGALPKQLSSIPNPPASFHDTYSINGAPAGTKATGISPIALPQPSNLSLNGATPTQYLNNLPQ